jgi:hypothetical protein
LVPAGGRRLEVDHRLRAVRRTDQLLHDVQDSPVDHQPASDPTRLHLRVAVRVNDPRVAAKDVVLGQLVDLTER